MSAPPQPAEPTPHKPSLFRLAGKLFQKGTCLAGKLFQKGTCLFETVPTGQGYKVNLGGGTLVLLGAFTALFWGSRQQGSEVARLRSTVNELKSTIDRQARGRTPGQEHPSEHPQEHPGGKQKSGKQTPRLSTDDLADAIQNYVKREAALKGGFFLVYDKDAGQTLTLTLERVHRERLSRVATDTYFACADFKSSEGKTYDLDVFMRGPSKDKLEVTEISVHKEKGKARYNWVEKQGVWSKVPVK